MTDREKLIELIYEGKMKRIDICANNEDCCDGVVADHLIANGVVVREKGEWVFDRVSAVCDFEVVKCSNCGYEAYAQAIHVKHGNFCPNCGADMTGGDRNV